LRIAIGGRVELENVRRQSLRTARDDWDLVAAGRDHDLIGRVAAGAGIKHEPVLTVAAQASHGHAFAQWRIE
jgi:hypothetical protein